MKYIKKITKLKMRYSFTKIPNELLKILNLEGNGL